jgi:hypothetical protein
MVDFMPFNSWGELTQDVTWSGTLYIGGDVIVPVGRTLTLEPGTTLKFSADGDPGSTGQNTSKTELIVYGDLVLKGKPGEPPVTLESDGIPPAPGDWVGLSFPQTANPNVSKSGSENGPVHKDKDSSIELKNFIVKYAETGINSNGTRKLELKDAILDSNRIGLSLSMTYEINNTGFRNSEVAGIILNNQSQGNIKGANLSNNTVGMDFRGLSSAECKNDTFLGNNTAVICSDGSAPVFREAYVSQSRDCGIKILNDAQPILGSEEYGGHNILFDNTPYQLYNSSSQNIHAINNYWGTMDPDTVAMQIWDGYDDPLYGFVFYQPLWSGLLGKMGGAQIAGGDKPLIPTIFALSQNYPNPCRLTTTISFALPKATDVSLRVYNVAGQLVKTLVEGNQDVGYYNTKWNGKDNKGIQVASGVYLYRLNAGAFTDTKKLIILK